jgi:hypothetical protein
VTRVDPAAAGNRATMPANEDDRKKALRGRWTDWLARWIRAAEEMPETRARAEPTTAASQTMRESINERRD